MNPFAEQTSAEVAEEAETERAGLVSTLDQLRENLRPENVVDEVFSQAQATSTDIMDKVWAVARDNPLPAALIGLGAAMLAGAGQRFRRKPSSIDPIGSEQRDPRQPFSDPSWIDRHDPLTETAMSHYSLRPRTGLARLLDEQPLILAALGMAVGAAVGSAIPSTDVEGQLLGDASESVRRNASAAAREQLSQLRSTATQTLDQMKATAAEHGLSTDNVSGLVHDLGEDVRTTAFPGGRDPEASVKH